MSEFYFVFITKLQIKVYNKKYLVWVHHADGIPTWNLSIYLFIYGLYINEFVRNCILNVNLMDSSAWYVYYNFKKQ